MTAQPVLVKFPVTLPNAEDAGKLAFILANVFTKEECQEWIDLTEQRGYEQALLNTGYGQVLMTDVRNNDRCIIDDVGMAEKLFKRIKPYLPEVWEGYQLVGLNERLRFLRYDPGHQFKSHMGKLKRENESIFVEINSLSRWSVRSFGWIR